MALLAGRREISEIVRFAPTLNQQQRRLLGLPRKPDRRAFYQVPCYSVFYAVLTRLDATAFAALVHDWLHQRAGTLPAALALDGKMIREHIGLLTLSQHDDGAPQAVGIYDQKEGTARCEQTAAAALLENIPALTRCRTPLFCPHQSRPRPGRSAPVARLRAGSDGGRFSVRAQLHRGAQRNHPKKTGHTSAETRYFIANAEPQAHTPAQWQALVRGHWGGVEIRNHWRRDAIWGEDGSRTRHATVLANLVRRQS